MDKTAIESRMQTAEAAYNTLNQFLHTTLEGLKKLGVASLTELQDEMNRLQGEFRALDGLRQQVPVTPLPTDPATTIDVEPTLKAQETHETKPSSKHPRK